MDATVHNTSQDMKQWGDTTRIDGASVSRAEIAALICHRRNDLGVPTMRKRVTPLRLLIC